jgi:hypothetical protein
MAASSSSGDTTIYLVALLVGVAIVAATLIRHAPWGVSATLGFLMSVLATRSLVVSAVLRWRARVRVRQGDAPTPTRSKARWRIRPS